MNAVEPQVAARADRQLPAVYRFGTLLAIEAFPQRGPPVDCKLEMIAGRVYVRVGQENQQLDTDDMM